MHRVNTRQDGVRSGNRDSRYTCGWLGMRINIFYKSITGIVSLINCN